MNYKLEKKDLVIWENDIYLLPTFRVCIDNCMYLDKNFSIEFHFLIFHCKLLFMKYR